MKIITTFLRAQLMALLAMSSVLVHATDIPLADLPLALRTEAAMPNVLFLFDDSGSMDTEDVFYAPAYDSDNEYRCSTGTVLPADTAKVLTIYVSMRASNQGSPFFMYGNTTYGWGNSGDANAAAGTAASRVCLNPYSNYVVRFKDYVSFGSGGCPSGYSESVDAIGNNYCWENSSMQTPGISTECPSGYTVFDDGTGKDCWKTTALQTPSITTACPSGYTLASGQCWKDTATIAVTVSVACSTGYTEVSGRCWLNTKLIAPTLSTACPVGFTQVGSTCWQNSQMVATTLSSACLAGYTLISGKCWKDSDRVSVSPTSSCPANYTMTDGWCWKNSDIGSTTTTNVKTCNAGYTLGLEGSNWRCWKNSDIRARWFGNCPWSNYKKITVDTMSPTSQCGNDANDIAYFDVPVVSCASGRTLLSLSPQKCGKDSSRVAITVVYNCLAGYTSLPASECGLNATSSLPAPITETCSAGYTKLTLVPTNKCGQNSSSQPTGAVGIESCPVNYTLLSMVPSNKCGDNPTSVTAGIAGIVSCPAGYTVIYAPTERCGQNSSTVPMQVAGIEYCNTGYQLLYMSPDHKCGQLSTIEPAGIAGLYICASGYSVLSDLSPVKCGKNSKQIPYTHGMVSTLIPGYETTTVTGNFLNWYLSATPSQLSLDTLLPGFPTYNAASPWAQTTSPATDNPAGQPWTQNPATVSSGKFDIDGTPQLGMKEKVSFYWDRITVAKDVGKMLVRKISNVNLSIGAYHTKYSTTSSRASSGTLLHALSSLEVRVDDPTTTNDDVAVATVKAKTETNKTSLIGAVKKITSGDGTPTAQAMVRMARYIFQGWEAQLFDYFDVVDAAILPAVQTVPRHTTVKKLSDVLNISMEPSAPTTTTVAQYSANKNLTQGAWCQKTAMAVLTDGQPSGDTGYAGSGPLGTYDTVGTAREDAYSDVDYKGIMRVPGALVDHDWIPGIRGNQNIESFFIAFGAEAVINDPIFEDAGMAAGAGTNNSFKATDGGAVVEAFKQIINQVTAASLSITAIAVSSVSELQTENYAFQATYDSQFFTSELKALNVNQQGLFVQPDGSGASRTSDGIIPEWFASDVMNKLYLLNDDHVGTPGSPNTGVAASSVYRTNGVKDRLVYTFNGTDGVRFGSSTMTKPSAAGSSFAEFNALPQTIRDDISVVTGNNSIERYDLMMYLLGDISNEINHPSVDTANNEKYRQRGSYNDGDNDGKIETVGVGGILGDIVHSSPVYQKVPSAQWNDIHFGSSTEPYSTYRALHADRKAIIYTGGNDGFLHAFTVEDGTKDSRYYPPGAELFAYMPTLQASTAANQGLHNLADKYYQHRFYVDLTPTLSDVYVDFYAAGAPDPEWRSVLVGGMGKGGRGYYALDVTCPFADTSYHVPPGDTVSVQNTCADESFNATNVLWEFDNTDDVDMGLSYSEPIIVKMPYNSALSDDPNMDHTGRYAAIVGNGYNSVNGRAALYILFLDGGLDGTWTPGVDYVKIYVSNASADKVTSKNGLSSATAIDINYDGMIDRIYAGDIKGQLWSFDVSSPGTKAQYLGGTLAWTANKLFTTGKDAATPQPITSAPMVARDSSRGRILPTSPLPDLMVVFGTGQYMTDADINDKSLQSVYAVHDRGTYGLNRYSTVTVDGTDYPKLEPRFWSETTLGTKRNRTISGDPLIKEQFGWYADLASDLNGDKAISGTAELQGERLVFRSFLVGNLFIFNSIIPVVGSCAGATQSWTLNLDWTSGVAYKDATYDANESGVIDPTDQGYVGEFNDSGGSALGRGGNNIYDSLGDIARSTNFNFGTIILSERIGWEEKMPFGVKGQ